MSFVRSSWPASRVPATSAMTTSSARVFAEEDTCGIQEVWDYGTSHEHITNITKISLESWAHPIGDHSQLEASAFEDICQILVVLKVSMHVIR